MDFSLELPTGQLATAILATVTASVTKPILNHSVRSFIFAQLVAASDGCLQDPAYDTDLLFAATVMHDLGTGEQAPGKSRFEVEGADLAAKLLSAHGVAAPDVDRVWEAIALHTSAGIAERRGLLSFLTREGVAVDFGRDVERVMEWAPQIHAAYPRLAMARSLTDAIVAQAARSPNAAPYYSFPSALLHERSSTGTTALEQATIASPWGE
ncbi:HD domain-containing protein [Kribbella jejuensis]|uniref:HD domain-containing protein n=1 Tax=Kribbella jejuensis TaxID=236068 RepID=A0A542ELF1_9ACTN|nr:HD domain-containing protein [Kribbella jejuensis]TQJ16016.1 HD domain-containing protein [Kribbella jejuensis]